MEINPYPYGYESAFVVTIDDVSALTPPGRIREVVSLLDEFGIKAVFFVIPCERGLTRFTEEIETARVLREALAGGHEVGQHGLTHVRPRKSLRSVNWASEFRGRLPYGEQRRRINAGRSILREAGFCVEGFRSPAFSAEFTTLRILASEGFLYGADIAVYPPPLMTANKKFAESLYFPFCPEGLDLVEFAAHGDYFKMLHNRKNFAGLRSRFERIYLRGGMFVLYAHIQYLDAAGLELLRRCMEFTEGRNIWKPNLAGFARWWKARGALMKCVTIRAGVLRVSVDKGNEPDLKGLAFRFREEIPAETYEIYDGFGALKRKGRISEGPFVFD